MIINRKNKVQVEMKNSWIIKRSPQEDEQPLIYEGFPMENDNGYCPSYKQFPACMRDTKNTKKNSMKKILKYFICCS